MFVYCKPHLWLFEANPCKFTLLEAAPWTKNGIRKNLSPRRCRCLEGCLKMTCLLSSVPCIYGKLYHHPILRCEPCEMTFHIRNLYIVSTASQALQIRFPPNLFVKVLRIQSACSSGGFGHWSFPDIFLDSKISCEIKLFTQGPWCLRIKAFMWFVAIFDLCAQKSGKESEWSMKKDVDLEACRTYIHFWIKVLLRCQCRWQVLVSSLYTECSNGDGVSFSRLALMELWVSYLYTGWRWSHHACGVIQGTFSSKSPSICSIKGLHLHWCKCCMFHFAPKQKMGILHCPQFLPSHCSSTTSLLGVRSFVFSGGLDLGSGRQNHMVKCLVNLANFKAQL